MNVQEAALALGLTPGQSVSEDDISEAYREMAKVTHPDYGGTTEQFQTVLQARHTLLTALRAPAPPGRRIRSQTRCSKCKGQGVIDSRRAWRVLKVRCPECKGTGASQPQGV